MQFASAASASAALCCSALRGGNMTRCSSGGEKLRHGRHGVRPRGCRESQSETERKGEETGLLPLLLGSDSLRPPWRLFPSYPNARELAAPRPGTRLSFQRAFCTLCRFFCPGEFFNIARELLVELLFANLRAALFIKIPEFFVCDSKRSGLYSAYTL